MNAGDVIERVGFYHWGGRYFTGLFGVILKKTYSTYDSSYDKWDVFMEGSVISLEARQMRSVK